MSGRKTALEKEMIIYDVTRDDLCRLLGISYQALHAKLTGKTEFKCNEMFAIKKRLNTKTPLEKLFS